MPRCRKTYLHLLAVDLARSPDGQWWVLSDRTQAPSGAGYALENRIVLAETFPDLFREFQVDRLASFFRSFRDTLLHLSPSRRDNPQVVMLTPGPFNETYFEHSYLARYLGFTLAQGGDLTVRDNRVFLKTLEGLKPVDVILRRVDDGFCDPIELRSDSFLGVAGLVEAVRAGNVAVANALGSGLIETSAFMPFLPGFSRRFLGEELTLPSVSDMVVRPGGSASLCTRAFGFAGDQTGVSLQRNGAGIRRATQDRRALASAHEHGGATLRICRPGAVESLHCACLVGKRLRPRRVVLRVYLAAAGDSWIAMPGGLARVSPSIDTPVVSMQRGGGSKDTWVLSDGPVDSFTMRRPQHLPVEVNRGGTSALPSRAADHIYWLGRYAERGENLARVLRCILMRVSGEPETSGSSQWDSLMGLYDCVESPHSRLATDDPQQRLDQTRDLEQEVLSLNI